MSDPTLTIRLTYKDEEGQKVMRSLDVAVRPALTIEEIADRAGRRTTQTIVDIFEDMGIEASHSLGNACDDFKSNRIGNCITCGFPEAAHLPTVDIGGSGGISISVPGVDGG